MGLKINYGINRIKPQANKRRKKEIECQNRSTIILHEWDWEKDHKKIHKFMNDLIIAKHPGWLLSGYAFKGYCNHDHE